MVCQQPLEQRLQLVIGLVQPFGDDARLADDVHAEVEALGLVSLPQDPYTELGQRHQLGHHFRVQVFKVRHVRVGDNHEVAVIVGEAVEDHVAQPAPVDDVGYNILLARLETEEAALWPGLCASQVRHAPGGPQVAHRLQLYTESAQEAIGDNPNDLPMFHHARISVAMANAPDEVKQKATVVAPGNDDEGVAWALQMFRVI